MSRCLFFLLLAALSIRLFWLALLPLGGDLLYPFLDADGYLNAAEAFHRGQFLDDGEQIKRMPLYPALSAFFTHWLSSTPFCEENPLQICMLRVWHVFLDLCVLVGLYLFAHRWLNVRAALLAGVLYAIYPLALYRIPVMNTELMQSAAIAFWLLGAARTMNSKKTGEMILLSLLSTVLVFISPALQFIPLFFSIYLVIALPWKESLRLSSALLIPFAVLCIGWGARNCAVTDQFFLFDTRGGKEFWLGNNQEVDGRWEGPQQKIWIAQWRDYLNQVHAQGGGEKEINPLLYRKGIEQIVANPVGAGVLFAKKLGRFWYVPASERMLWITFPLQSFYLLLASFGVWASGIHRRGTVLPLFIIGYYASIYTLSYACIRFSLPVMPWVCVLAGAGLAYLWKEKKEQAA